MKVVLAVLALALAGWVSGCSAAVSIRPLYTDEDLKKPVVEPRIVGEWISPNTEEPEKASSEEVWLRWKITPPDKPGEAYSTYSVEFRLGKPDPEKGDEVSSYHLRLVAVGDKLFFDAEFRSHAEGQMNVGPEDVLGLVPAHVVGRIWVQQDFLRIALLKPDWVEENWPAGSYRFSSSNYGDDSIVITGATQELRDFLVRNADNPKALAYVAYLCRPWTDCGTRAAEDALARSPDDDQTLQGASEFFFSRHNYARAAALRQRQLELDPSNFERRTDVGEALLFSRSFAGARQEFAAAQKLILGDPPAAVGSLSNYLGGGYARAAEGIVWSYFLEGEYAEAVNAAKKYRPDREHLSAYPILLTYFSLLRLGRREAAESLLKDEIAGFRGSDEDHILLAGAQGRVSSYSPDRKSGASRPVSFFDGLRDIAMGRPGAARAHLESAAAGPSDSVIALAARIELERLEAKPRK